MRLYYKESLFNIVINIIQDSILFDGRDSASPSCDNTGNFTLVRKKENRVEQWARYSEVSLDMSYNLLVYYHIK